MLWESSGVHGHRSDMLHVLGQLQGQLQEREVLVRQLSLTLKRGQALLVEGENGAKIRANEDVKLSDEMKALNTEGADIENAKKGVNMPHINRFCLFVVTLQLAVRKNINYKTLKQ